MEVFWYQNQLKIKFKIQMTTFGHFFQYRGLSSNSVAYVLYMPTYWLTVYCNFLANTQWDRFLFLLCLSVSVQVCGAA